MKRFILTVTASLLAACACAAVGKPNVILVLTDDQGYGEVGAHGNTMIRTPHLDKLHSQAVRLTDYHVDPTCAPTRSALLTGRYSTRTGVWHTIMGRSLMSTEELTVAEVLKAGGYRTAMFGKWHLGDNYPSRPQDQGFDETFYHGGGGVTQTPDYFGNDYFDDTYFRNGTPEKTKGYCTDVWFDNAMAFIDNHVRAHKDRPFFVYLATNAPHGPYLVADKYKAPYVKRGVTGSMAPFYGMITNIDENMGRLRAKLRGLKIEDNTILIFTSDNGTAAGMRRGRRRGRKGGAAPDAGAWKGFNAGMRGTKGSEFDGGHRVPFFIRWPAGGLTGGRDVDKLTAHIDILPTLAALCGVSDPKANERDGRSLARLLKGDAAGWPDRTVLVHSQRIEHPTLWRKSSIMTQQWRLVNGKELHNMIEYPDQSRNVADQHPAVVKRLTAEYKAWWKSLSPVFPEYVNIVLGNDAENPANLTCHDWHTNNKAVPWNQGHIRRGPVANGFWAVDVEKAGRYEITLRRWPQYVGKPVEAKKARLKIANADETIDVDPQATGATFRLNLPKGATRLETWLTLPDGKVRGAYFVEVNCVGP